MSEAATGSKPVRTVRITPESVLARTERGHRALVGDGEVSIQEKTALVMIDGVTPYSTLLDCVNDRHRRMLRNAVVSLLKRGLARPVDARSQTERAVSDGSAAATERDPEQLRELFKRYWNQVDESARSADGGAAPLLEDEITSDVKSLAASAEAHAEEVRKLSAEIDARRAERDGLTAFLAVLNEDIKRQATVKEQLEKRVEKLALERLARLEEVKQRRQTMQGDLDAIEAEARSLHEALEAGRGNAAALALDLEQRERDAQQSRERAAALMQEHAASVDSATTLARAIEQAKQEEIEGRKTLESLPARQSELNAAIQAASGPIEALERSLADLQEQERTKAARARNREAAVAKLDAKLDALAGDLRARGEAANAARERARQIEADIAAATARIEGLQASKREAERQLDEHTDVLVALKRRAKALESEAQRLRERNEATDLAVQGEIERDKALRQEREDLLAKQQAELGEARARHAEHATRVNAHRSAVKRLEADIAAATDALAARRAGHAQIERDMAELAPLAASARQALESARGDLSRAEAETAEIEARYAAAWARAAEANAGLQSARMSLRSDRSAIDALAATVGEFEGMHREARVATAKARADLGEKMALARRDEVAEGEHLEATLLALGATRQKVAALSAKLYDCRAQWEAGERSARALRLAQARTTADRAQDAAAQLQFEREGAEARIAAARALAESRADAAYALAANRAATEAQALEIAARTLDQRAQLNQARGALQAIENERGLVEAHLKFTNDDLLALKERLGATEAERNDVTSRLDANSAAVARARELFETGARELAELEAGRATAGAQILQIAGETEEHRAQLKAARGMLRSVADERGTVEAKVKFTQDDLLALKEGLRRIEAEREEVNRNFDQHSTALGHAREMLEAAASQRAELESGLAALRADVEARTVELETARAALNEATATRDSARTQADQAVAETRSLEEALLTARESVARIRNDTEEALAERQRLEGETADNLEELKAARTAAALARERFEAVLREVDELRGAHAKAMEARKRAERELRIAIKQPWHLKPWHLAVPVALVLAAFGGWWALDQYGEPEPVQTPVPVAVESRMIRPEGASADMLLLKISKQLSPRPAAGATATGQKK